MLLLWCSCLPGFFLKLESVVFKFFWSGKPDLVARKVVVHSRHSGGFEVVCTKFKVFALVVQWIRRFLSSSGAWVSLLTFWFFDRFGVGPYHVLSDPFRFSPAVLPPFYCSLLRAWQALGGSGSQNTLVVGSLTNSPLTASSFSCKSCYELLLCLNPCQPHCVTKFLPSFGHLDWPVIWRQLFSFLWTGKLLISAGRFVMVFLTPLSSFLRLVLLFLRSVFVATTTSLSNIFFSLALWLRVVSIGSSPSCLGSLRWLLLSVFDTCFLVSLLMNYAVSLKFLPTY